MSEPLEYRAVRLCSGKGSYEVLPLHPVRLQLEKLRDGLAGSGRAVVDVRVMLIVQGKPETTILEDGRVLIKTRKEEEARAEFERLLPLLRTAVQPGRSRR